MKHAGQPARHLIERCVLVHEHTGLGRHNLRHPIDTNCDDGNAEADRFHHRNRQALTATQRQKSANRVLPVKIVDLRIVHLPPQPLANPSGQCMGRSDYSLALGTVPEVNPSDRTIQSLQEWRHKMDSLERNQTPARKHDRDSVYPCRPTSRLRLDAQAGNP